MTKVVPNVKRATLIPHIEKNVEQGAIISTDEMQRYHSLLSRGYKHGTVLHGQGEYVCGIHHVNGLEGFWSRLKNSILGTHIHISRKHLPKYLAEFEYRHNMRFNPAQMFDRLLVSF